MPQRRFLIAPSLARLVRKEQGVAGRIVEGYFAARPDRDHFVSIEPGHAYLVLAPAKEGAGDEERTEVPRSQAEALLAVCAGKVGFEATGVQLPGGRHVLLQHVIVPGPLNLLSVELAEGEDASAFVPPTWFGPEVTQNPAYNRGALARVGLPAPEEIPLSNTMLNDLLDILDGRVADAQFSPVPSPRVSETAPANGNAEQGPSDPAAELPAAPAEGARMDDMMAGLAEALQVQAPHSTPDSKEAAVVRSLRWGKR